MENVSAVMPTRRTASRKRKYERMKKERMNEWGMRGTGGVKEQKKNE